MSGLRVTAAVDDTLQEWFEYALVSVCADEGADGVPPLPVGWVRPTDPDNTTKDQFPLVVTTTTEPAEFTRLRHGVWSAVWPVFVTVILRGDTVDEVADRMHLYLAAVELIGVQKPTWGGLVSDTDLVAARAGLGDPQDTRTMAIGHVEFGLRVDGTLLAEPAWPDAVPPKPWPPAVYTADEIDLDVTRLPS